MLRQSVNFKHEKCKDCGRCHCMKCAISEDDNNENNKTTKRIC